MINEEQKLVNGGEFIVRDVDPKEVFTPEDFSEEQLMMKWREP